MPEAQELISTFVLLWAVIDPIRHRTGLHFGDDGTAPMRERRHIARIAALARGPAFLFCSSRSAKSCLRAMGVPFCSLFQISGGIILFLFALTMIFGEGKPYPRYRAALTMFQM